MRRTALILLLVLLGGCSRASMPNLEDIPPEAQASADGPMSASNAPGSSNPQTSADARAVANAAVAVELTPEQRIDIEKGVERGLPDARSPVFGSMTARISQFTTQSYIVCGWVNSGDAGPQPFVAMYVPKMKNALLIGVGGREAPDVIRERCAAEGVPLNS